MPPGRIFWPGRRPGTTPMPPGTASTWPWVRWSRSSLRCCSSDLGLDVQRFAPLGYPATDELARQRWPELRAAMSAAFASRTQEEWCQLLEGTDACVAPVLSVAEAPGHPHNAARKTFISVDGVLQNAPAPRFSRTPGAIVPPRVAGRRFRGGAVGSRLQSR